MTAVSTPSRYGTYVKKPPTPPTQSEIENIPKMFSQNANRILLQNALPSVTKIPYSSSSRHYAHTTVIPSHTTQENLKLCQAPIFYLSRIFAIFPFDQSQPLKVNCTSLLLSFIFLALCCGYSVRNLRVVHETEETNTNILLYTGYAVVNILFSVACIVVPILNRQFITSIIHGKCTGATGGGGR